MAPVAEAEEGKSLLARSRLRRLLEARKQEFAEWPQAERERLLQAFSAGDNKGTACLDARGLRIAFSELGMDPRAAEEKDAIYKLSREAAANTRVNFFDFVFIYCPEVEMRLEELRSPKLYAVFSSLDKGTGRLKEPEALEAILELVRTFEGQEGDTSEDFQLITMEMPKAWKDFAYQEGYVDFKAFQHLVGHLESQRADFRIQMEKRIISNADLTMEVEVSHRGELAHLRRTFDFQDPAKGGSINPSQMLAALMECGSAPAVGPTSDRIKSILSEHASETSFTFKDFLNFIHNLREEEQVNVKRGLSDLFERHGCGPSPLVSAIDVPLLIVGLGICTDCNVHRHCIDTFVTKHNQESSDAGLRVEGLVPLLARVAEAIRNQARGHEVQVAKQNDLHHTMGSLRDQYAELSRGGGGRVGVEEVSVLLKRLNPKVPLSDGDVERLIVDVCPPAKPPGDASAMTAAAVTTQTAPTDRSMARRGTVVAKKMLQRQDQDDAGPSDGHGHVRLVECRDKPRLPMMASLEELAQRPLLYFDGYIRLAALLMKE